jgi:DNA-binding winged helix-turn-helix (wHTH) protein/tetratricopeptide (TPR) repeat protein
MRGQSLWFGPFRFDALDKRVWRGPSAVPLTPKAFDVLHVLVRHPGRLVTKHQLLDDVWPGVHVGDAVLKVCVREIRRALGDAAHTPRFVETVHGRGYRFIAPLEQEAASGVALSRRSPFVGRTAELERLRAALERARRGDRQLVFVTGEPGIGKTSLVDAFLDEASADSAVTTAKGHCLEHAGAGEAYLPVLEALGRLCRAPGGERVVATLRKYAPTWLVQMPFLVTPADRGHLTREILGTTRDRMLREITEALEVLTAETPLLLVLEDLHWSDHATGDLIGWLARGPGPGQLLLVGTYRPADVHARQHPLRVVMHGPRACEELALDLLNETAVAGFLDARFPGHRFPETLARLIHRRTEGNPLFMVAAADFLVSRRTIVPAAGGWELRLASTETEIGTPETLRSMLEEQIDRLSSVNQRLLEVASVAGVEFTAEAVAKVGSIPSALAEERCERLARRRQFLRSAGHAELPDGTMVSKYAFIHVLYQHAFYQRVPAGRRARLHRRLGEYGEHAYGAAAVERAPELAEHFERGGVHLRAIDYLRQAAENALRRYANREAIAYLTRADELRAHVPEPDRSRLRVAVLERRGVIRRATGDAAGAAEDFEALATEAHERGQADGEAKALFYLASTVFSRDPARCLTAARRAVELSSSVADPLLQARTLGAAGYWRSVLQGWQEDDRHACAAALAAARRSADRSLESLLIGRFCYFDCVSSEYRRAAALADQGRQLALDVGDAYEYLFSQYHRALALLFAGEWSELQAVLADSRQVSDRNGHWLWPVAFRLERAWLHTEASDYAGAQTLAEEALAQARRAQYPYGERMSLLVLGLSHVGLGRRDTALEYFQQAGAWAEQGRPPLDWLLEMPLHHGLAVLRLDRGEAKQAREHAQWLEALATRCGERTWCALAAEALALIAEAEHKFARADEELARALSIVEGSEVPLADWRVHETATRLCRRRGRLEQAARHCARSARRIRRLAQELRESAHLRDAFLASPRVRAVLQADGQNLADGR